MRMDRRCGSLKAAGIALAALGLVLGSPASAKQFNMTGSWIIRNGQVFIPLQFPLTAVTMGMTWHATGTCNATLTMLMACGIVGGPLKAINFPNGPVLGGGVVTASGGTTTLMVPQGVFKSLPTAALPLQGVTLVQITSMFSVDAPFSAASLMKAGGPGAFTWCPTNPVCTKNQGLNGIGRGNARVIYKGGGNQFGGTMQIGLRQGGINSALFNATPFQVSHFQFGAAATLRELAPGGGAKDVPASEMVYLGVGVVTQPFNVPTANGLISQQGPFLTQMGGLTNTVGGSPPLLTINIGMSKKGKDFGQATTNYGFPHTTRTVVAQQTAAPALNGDDFLTLMGYDDRGPNGGGNIATVAGGISFRNTKSVSGQPYASLHKVWLKLQTPVPTMSPAGFAAAAALMVLAVGYALRRRLG